METSRGGLCPGRASCVIKSTVGYFKAIILQLKINEFKLKKNKKYCRDFHGGSVDKNLPSDTRDATLIPGQRTKIPHVVGQPNLLIATKILQDPSK